MRGFVLAMMMASGITATATAQVGIVRPAPIAADSVRGGHKPLTYFFRSLAIPGWGQASLDRKLTGGLFVAFEGLALGMTMKATTELRYLQRTDTAAASSRRAERQDWLILLAFNHLFSALEAYVSAHLISFPRDLHLRVFPGARPAAGFSIGIPH